MKKEQKVFNKKTLIAEALNFLILAKFGSSPSINTDSLKLADGYMRLAEMIGDLQYLVTVEMSDIGITVNAAIVT